MTTIKYTIMKKELINNSSNFTTVIEKGVEEFTLLFNDKNKTLTVNDKEYKFIEITNKFFFKPNRRNKTIIIECYDNIKRYIKKSSENNDMYNLHKLLQTL